MGIRVSVVLAGLLLLPLLSVLSVLPWLRYEYLTPDLAQTVYHVKELHLGRVIYRDIFNHHFLGFLLPLYLLDSVVDIRPPFLWVINIGHNLVFAVGMYLLVGAVSTKRSAWLAALLTVTLGWAPGIHGVIFNVQSQFVPLLSFVAYFVILSVQQKRPLLWYLAALLYGAIALCDQRLIFFATLLSIPPIVEPALRRTATLGKAIVCSAVFPVFAACYLLYRGVWGYFIEATFVFPLEHRNHGIEFSLGSQLLWVLRSLLQNCAELSIPALIGLLLALRCERRLYLGFVALALLVGATLFAVAGGREYPNYLLPFLPLLLMCAALLPEYYQQVVRRKPWRLAATALLVLVAALAPLSRLANTPRSRLFITPDSVQWYQGVGQYIRDTTEGTDPILVWGYCPELYLYSDRFSGFRDIGLLSVAGAVFNSTDSQQQNPMPSMTQAFDRYLTDEPPRLFVYCYHSDVARGGSSTVASEMAQRNFDFTRVAHLAFLKAHIAEQYTFEKRFEYGLTRVDIFRLNGAR